MGFKEYLKEASESLDHPVISSAVNTLHLWQEKLRDGRIKDPIRYFLDAYRLFDSNFDFISEKRKDLVPEIISFISGFLYTASIPRSPAIQEKIAKLVHKYSMHQAYSNVFDKQIRKDPLFSKIEKRGIK